MINVISKWIKWNKKKTNKKMDFTSLDLIE